jgi:hypothetical protein
MGIMKHTRLDVVSFGRLLEAFRVEFASPILHENRQSCLAGRILEADDVMGLVLHGLATGCRAAESCVMFGIPEGTRSKYWKFGLECLHRALQSMPEAAIAWPTTEKIEEFGARIASRVPSLGRAFGVVDGSLFAIPRPAGSAVQRLFYSGHKAKHAIRCVFVFAPDGTMIWFSTNYPGSWHDSHCAEIGGLYRELRENVPAGRYVLADSGFRRVGGRILTTFDNRSRMGRPFDVSATLQLATTIIARARVMVEWSIGGLKNTFRILAGKLPGAVAERSRVLETSFMMWNYRVRTTNISEVAKVFDPSESIRQMRHRATQLFNLSWQHAPAPHR